MKKKKVVIMTDYSLAKTGFGRNARAILENLYQKDKYELIHYCVGVVEADPRVNRTPWKSIGCLPSSQEELMSLNKDPRVARAANYGNHLLDKVINSEKPDVYIAIQDIWGIDFALQKKWYDKITCALWTTLDSLPILPSAIEASKKAKNFWVWSNFAEKAMKKSGATNVKTLHGAVEKKHFYRLEEHKRKSLRKENNINSDSFVIGFVFRNQLRKSVPNLLEGYSLFKKNNPEIKSNLLLHTHWGEGWNIHKLASEYSVPHQDILTTYVCKTCKSYSVKNFTGQEQKCTKCNSEKSCVTTSPAFGITESQLNEIYNLMDVYCHPFTSGGQEIPIQEAKLAELVTLVTNYSCGEEMCEEGAGSLPLDWSEYREHETEFIKASTYPSSIAKNLNKVLAMKESARREMGKQAREWTIKNFSTESICEQLEDFIDKAPFSEYSFDKKEEVRNPNYIVPQIENNTEWLIDMYKNILKQNHIDEKDDGVKYWLQELAKGVKREAIESYFKQVALKENSELFPFKLDDVLDKDDEGRRILYVIPTDATSVFLSTSLFENIKKTYPHCNLYVAAQNQNFDILSGNPYVHKVIPFSEEMNKYSNLEGEGKNKGFFEVVFTPHISAHIIKNYIHNGKDKLQISLK